MDVSKRSEAIDLRYSGKSLSEISAILRVSKSSVSVWVRDVVLSKEALGRIESKRNKARLDAAETKKILSASRREVMREAGRLEARKGDALHLKGCMLYWAEGSKERRSIRFCNSNPEMIRLFVRFLVVSLGVIPSKISYRIHMYDDVFPAEEIQRYWKEVVDMEAARQHDPVVNPYTEFSISKSKRKGKLPLGTCHLIVHSTKLVQHIYGALEVYGDVVIDPS